MGHLCVMLLTVLQLAIIVSQNHAEAQRNIPFRPIVLGGDIHRCPPQHVIETLLYNIKNNITDILQLIYNVPNCGNGPWLRVAYFDMSDPSQQCPSAWMEVTYNGIKTCGRPNSTTGSCPSTLYPVSHQYSKVCGRLIGYQFGSTDAFSIDDLENSKRTTIDEPYVDGISITNGMPRTHIWTFAAGASENGSCISLNCPCSNGNHLQPSYVGSNYYCESAYQDDCYMSGVFFFGDPLWDGQQCDNEGTCCTGANNPPWFSVDLSDSTNEDIEVHICHNQPTTDEDTPIQLLEIYVQ